ncbi:MAG: NAD(P)-dependent oxidoreductase [Caldilineaceae bacterium]
MSANTVESLPTVGFIGLGAMGQPMALSLMAAGYPLVAFDLSAERLDGLVDAGAAAALSVENLVGRVNVIATSLPSSSAFVEVAEQRILPNVQPGQIVIDFGTVTPPETRRLAACFAQKAAALIDAPVSGGPVGAQNADLYMFVGGAPDIVTQVRPILETVGGVAKLTYCGPAGCGQVVKGVNQLMMGLVDAAYLEAIAFGVNAGVDINVIAQAIGHEGRWRKDFSAIAQRIAQGNGANVGVKFRELPYFLLEADEADFPLPLTKTLYDFCDKGDRVVIDDNRPAPSFWLELTGSTANPHP